MINGSICPGTLSNRRNSTKLHIIAHPALPVMRNLKWALVNQYFMILILLFKLLFALIIYINVSEIDFCSVTCVWLCCIPITFFWGKSSFSLLVEIMTSRFDPPTSVIDPPGFFTHITHNAYAWHPRSLQNVHCFLQYLPDPGPDPNKHVNTERLCRN